MNRSTLLLIAILTLAICGSASPARAAGLGFYVEAEGGSGTWTLDEIVNWWMPGTDNGVDSDADLAAWTIGFIFDTNPSRPDRVFAYRLKVGFSGLGSDLDNSTGEFRVNGIVLDNTFGFGVHRTDKLRVWVGPSLRLGRYWGDFENPSTGTTTDAQLGEFGVGAAIGANFRVGDSLTLCVEGGGRWRSFFIGDTDTPGETSESHDVTGKFFGGYAGVSLLFRTGADRR